MGDPRARSEDDRRTTAAETTLTRLRRICRSLPEVTERPSHGAPTWFVRGQRSFLSYWGNGHHADTFPHLRCAAGPGVQAELVSAEPDRFFRPPYVGGRGWIGVRLDRDVDWDELAAICPDADRAIAPPTLLARTETTEL